MLLGALYGVTPLAAPRNLPSSAAGGADAAATKIRIDNFGRVNAHYYRGAQPSGRDYADLAALGIKAVVNLTSDDAQENEQALVEGATMTYLAVPMTTRQPPTAEQLTEFLRFVNDPAHQPVFVHCVGGRHRTGVMTAAYRMTEEGWSPDQAFREMKQYKFGADLLHPEFKQFVYSFLPARPQAAPSSAVLAGAAGASR